MHLGLGRFESVSILGFNSPEWHLSNMGAIAAGGFAAGIYTTNEPDACKYILKHSNARIVVVDGQKQLDKILKIRGDLPKLVAIVVWGEELPAGVNDGIGAGQAKAYGWDEFLGLGASVSDAEVEARIADQKPGHSVHSTLHEEAKSPLRVGRAGGALKLSPTVELFVYDDEDGPNSRRGLAPGSVRENRDKVRALRSVAGADWAHLDDAAAARILGEQNRKATGPAFRWHSAPPPPPPPPA